MVKCKGKVCFVLAYLSLLNTAEFKESYRPPSTIHAYEAHARARSHSIILRLRGGVNSRGPMISIPAESTECLGESMIESNIEETIHKITKPPYETLKASFLAHNPPTSTQDEGPADSSSDDENAAKKLPLPEGVRRELRLREEGVHIAMGGILLAPTDERAWAQKGIGKQKEIERKCASSYGTPRSAHLSLLSHRRLQFQVSRRFVRLDVPHSATSVLRPPVSSPPAVSTL
jgi:hypothetical protein